MDQYIVGGTNAISVAISDPKKKKVSQVDPRHLIATNLSFHIVKEDVQKIFEPVLLNE